MALIFFGFYEFNLDYDRNLTDKKKKKTVRSKQKIKKGAGENYNSRKITNIMIFMKLFLERNFMLGFG